MLNFVTVQELGIYLQKKGAQLSLHFTRGQIPGGQGMFIAQVHSSTSGSSGQCAAADPEEAVRVCCEVMEQNEVLHERRDVSPSAA